MEAATKVLEESGFRDTRIADIAIRAGVSHGVFYHYFDSKEEIFREIVASGAQIKGEEPGPDAALTRKGARTRTLLVEAATRVFEEVGFRDARITDIAERAGVSHGSFYHYFDSKEQVFREIAEAAGARLTSPAIRDTSEPVPVGAPHVLRIRRAIRRYLERYRDAGKIMGVIEEVSRFDSTVNEARLSRQQEFADRSEESIRRLQRDGLVNPDLNPKFAAIALGAMVARFAELWMVQGYADFDLDEAVDQLTLLSAGALDLRDEPQHRPTPKRRNAEPRRARPRSAAASPAG